MNTIEKLLTEKQRLARQRQRHHDGLECLVAEITGAIGSKSGLQLWRELRRVEQLVCRLAEQYCNGEIEEKLWDDTVIAATERVKSILGAIPPGFFVNGDPRGYALKIHPPHCGR
jgi:hypothetical protein